MRQETGFIRVGEHLIAYARVGEGPPLVLPPWWVSHIAEDWENPGFRRWIEWLAAGRTVIRYDRLGVGLSDRERPGETLSLEYEAIVLGRVIEELGLERPALLGVSCGACVAARFAAERPQGVERLALYGSYANGQALGTESARRGVVELVRTHWGLGSRLIGQILGSPEVDKDRFAAFQRRAASSEVAADLLELIYGFDVRESLGAIEQPTLVLHRDRDRAIPQKLGDELAAQIPQAALGRLHGEPHPPWYGDGRSVVAALARFLGISEPAAEPAAEPSASVVAELSDREREILALIAEGLSDPLIAERLVLSPHTVHRHVANIYGKLGLHSRAAAATLATRVGLR